ncbi:MAG: sigma 54-interacting transcriptional regulator [Deltaproteobacteria bacterium]|nr:sigma 54-interacting transcriptional regulator [Deltaproteobacteria bacterium]
MSEKGKSPEPIQPGWGRINYDRLLNAVSNGVVAINDQGRIVCFNSSAEQVFQITVKEAMDRPILEVLPNTGGILLECLSTGESFPGYRLKGQYVEIMANISPILRDQKLIGAVSVFQKISEFEDMAKELDAYKKMNRQLNAVFESSYDGLFITDGSGLVLKLNKSSERLNGHIIRDVIGKNIQDIVAEGYIDRSVSLEVLKRKTPLTIMQKLKNGKQIIVTGTPVFDENGQIDFVVTNERDITYLTLMKNQLQSNLGATEIAISPPGGLNGDAAGSDPIALSPGSREAFATARALARFDTTLLILGESGPGKSFFANYIHKLSPRRNHRFLKINCGAIPETLMESELFGYRKGAFTGADAAGKPGLAQIAHHGTLFLDEIGELSVNMQVKLLTLLEDKEVIPVGGTEPIKIDLRIIAATNSDLRKRVTEGRFRQDLYYRLNIAPIHIPPLRERREDIPALIRSFILEFNRKHDLKKSISPEMVAILCAYHYPGNIRELQNIIERLIIMCTRDEIRATDLSRHNLLEPFTSLPDSPEETEVSLRQALEEHEKRIIVNALKRHGNKYRAARVLGIDPSTLGRKVKKHLIPSSQAILH